jgi:hypothetical protein
VTHLLSDRDKAALARLLAQAKTPGQFITLTGKGSTRDKVTVRRLLEKAESKEQILQWCDEAGRRSAVGRPPGKDRYWGHDFWIVHFAHEVRRNTQCSIREAVEAAVQRAQVEYGKLPGPGGAISDEARR